MAGRMNRLPWPPHGIHPAPLTDQVDAPEDHLSSYGQPLVLLERIPIFSRVIGAYVLGQHGGLEAVDPGGGRCLGTL